MTDGEMRLKGQEIVNMMKDITISDDVIIAQISEMDFLVGIKTGENHNLPKSEDARQPQVTPEKEEAIMKAFKHFGVI